MGLSPRSTVAVVGFTPTLSTGTVPCCQRDGLIVKEELGVLPWCVDCPLPPLELQQAGNPAPVPPTNSPKPAGIIVKDASVAQKRSSSCGRFNRAERSDAVCVW